ncbi:MAG: hypothetical protein ACK5NY_10500 [Burkholderiaceae bacterium]|jgi:hypothetical protein
MRPVSSTISSPNTLPSTPPLTPERGAAQLHEATKAQKEFLSAIGMEALATFVGFLCQHGMVSSEDWCLTGSSALKVHALRLGDETMANDILPKDADILISSIKKQVLGEKIKHMDDQAGLVCRETDGLYIVKNEGWEKFFKIDLINNDQREFACQHPTMMHEELPIISLPDLLVQNRFALAEDLADQIAGNPETIQRRQKFVEYCEKLLSVEQILGAAPVFSQTGVEPTFFELDKKLPIEKPKTKRQKLFF